MPRRLRRWGRVVALVCVCAGARAAPAPTAADFARHAKFETAEISPDGKHLAVTTLIDGNLALGVLDIPITKIVGAMKFTHGEEVARYWWVGPNRIVAELARNLGPLDQPYLTGELVGMNADGSNVKYLFGAGGSAHTGSHIGNKTGEYASGYVLDANTLAPAKVIIAVDDWHDGDSQQRYVRQMNADTGNTVEAGLIPTYYPFSVAFAPGGQALLAAGTDGSNHAILLRFGADTQQWRRVDRPESHLANAEVLSILPDDDHVIYLSDEESPRLCVRSYDLEAEGSRSVSCDARVDVSQVLGTYDRKKIVAIGYEDGKPRLEYPDPDDPDAKLLQMLQRTFVGQRLEITSWTEDGSRLVLHVNSDRNPGDFYLVDHKTHKADYLLSTHEWIDPEQMRPMEPIRYESRDGLRIDGYLTRPGGPVGTRVPLVLMPHGGPHGPRDYWTWNAWGQWLASRGYAVLQVNYRGSGGYGRGYEAEGYRHWGDLMQDDLADGVHWAIAQGIADPARVCVFGASWGGYAALMSAEREPELYRCAASLAGVYDLAMQESGSDTAEYRIGRAYFDRVLGRDPKVLAAQSPITGVARIKAALYIAHGTEDERVPFKQAKALRKALENAGKPFEWHEYDGEEHGFYKETNEADFLLTLAAFLDRNIGPAAAAPAKTDAAATTP